VAHVTTLPDGTQNLHIDINAGPDGAPTPAAGPMALTIQDSLGGDDSFEQDYGKRIEQRQFQEAQAGLQQMGIAPPDADPFSDFEREGKQRALAAMGVFAPVPQDGQPKQAAQDDLQSQVIPGQAKQPEMQPGATVAKTEPMQPQAAPRAPNIALDGTELPTQAQDNGPLTNAWEISRSQGAAFLKGTWQGVAGLVKPLDQMADLAHELVTDRLKSAGYTDADMERMGVSKVKLFENMLSWTDHYIKDLDGKITVKDFFSSVYTALGQAPAGMLEFAYGGGWYPMKGLIESAHQSTMGVQPGDVPTAGRQVTQNPVGAAAIDAVAGAARYGMAQSINHFAGLYGAVTRTLGQAGWGALETIADPAMVGAGVTPTTEQVGTGALVQGLFGLAFPSRGLNVRKLSRAEAAPYSRNLAVAYEALQAGKTDAASYQMVKHLTAAHPEMDQKTRLAVSDELLLIPTKVLQSLGIQAQYGQAMSIAGSATTGLEGGVFKAVIGLYDGHDASTVAEEFGHTILDHITKAQQGKVKLTMDGKDVTADFVAAGEELRAEFERTTGLKPGDKNYNFQFRESVMDTYLAWAQQTGALPDGKPLPGPVAEVFNKTKELLAGILQKTGEVQGNKVSEAQEKAFRAVAGQDGGLDVEGAGSVDPGASLQVKPVDLAAPWAYTGPRDALVDVRRRVAVSGQKIIENQLPTDLQDFAVNINLGKLAHSYQTGAADIIQEVANAIGPEMEAARRGVVSDKEVMAGAIAGLANDLGMTEATLLQRHQGQAFNAEQVQASRIVLFSSAQQLADLARSVRDGSNSDANLWDFARRMELHSAVQAQVAGMTAEAGRALRAFKTVVGQVTLPDGTTFNPNAIKAQEAADAASRPELRMPGEQVPDGADAAPGQPALAQPAPPSLDSYRTMLDTVGGRAVVEQMARNIADLADQGADLTQLNTAVQQAQRRTWRDWVMGWRYHSMLSGVPTHARNTIGNTLVAVLSVPETAVAGMLGVAARGVGSRNPEHVMLGESKELVYGYMGAVMDSFKLAGQAFKSGEDPFGTTKIEGRPSVTISQDSQTMVGRTADVLWDFVNLPGRFLGAEDAFFKNEAFRANLRKLAYRTAAMEGLDGPPMTERIQELLNNPTDKMLADSLDAAKYQTFQSDLTGAIAKISQAANAQDNLGFIAKVFVPFIRTPWNIARYTLTRTPMAPLFRSFREDMGAGGARSEMAMSRVIVGSALMAWGTSLVNQGVITGGGPSEPGERNVWLMNFKPYSLKVGDQWYSYGNLAEPVSTFFALSADFHDAYTNWQADPETSAPELAAAMTVAFSKNITSKTFMKGVSDIAALLDKPDRSAGPWLNSLTGSFIPAYLGNWANSQDPEIRLVGNVLDAMKNRTPGLKDDLPLRRNLWGEPVLSTELGPALAYISPMKVFTDKADSVEKEMLRLGMSVQMPRETISIEGVDIELTKAEYSRYMELVGELPLPRRGTPMTIKDYLSDMIDSPSYQRLADKDGGAAAEEIKSIIGVYQSMARDQLLEESDRLSNIVDDTRAARREK
jgi:hypothetical protein